MYDKNDTYSSIFNMKNMFRPTQCKLFDEYIIILCYYIPIIEPRIRDG